MRSVFASISISMRKFIFGTTFLFITPFLLVFLLVGILALYVHNHSKPVLTHLGNTVAYAALPTAQNTMTAEITESDGRIEKIRQFLARYGSPLEPYAADIVEAADQFGLDYRLVPSIAMQESNLCKKIPDNSYNCWGYGIYGKQVKHFKDFKDGIYTVTEGLSKNYKKNGLVTPNQIMSVYTPSSNGSWAFGVNHFMAELQ